MEEEATKLHVSRLKQRVVWLRSDIFFDARVHAPNQLSLGGASLCSSSMREAIISEFARLENLRVAISFASQVLFFQPANIPRTPRPERKS